ncbi:hypothetical protein [Acidisarcina polymorpha]|uniref:hypothetical protein n=1 Tax=Acidisarcina polymorpha TaxID=2211140 RepID=UPI000DEEFFB2|nr:hypothetical protein [Acidisarcina polymorpha]
MNKLKTAFGAPAVDNKNTAGARGPALLQDICVVGAQIKVQERHTGNCAEADPLLRVVTNALRGEACLEDRDEVR